MPICIGQQQVALDCYLAWEDEHVEVLPQRHLGDGIGLGVVGVS